MGKFKDKKTGIIYSVTTPSLNDSYKNNSQYEEVDKKSDKPKKKKTIPNNSQNETPSE